jgi:signal transduction histidine kinase
VVKRGTVAINGSTGTILGQSLIGLRDLVDSTLSDVRAAASHQRPERVALQPFLNEVAVAARLQAEYGSLQFTVEPIAPDLSAQVDRQLLESAVMNLLNNAFKYTGVGGQVRLRAHRADVRVVIEVEDECGGIPESKGDPFRPFAERRARERDGVGLGLSVARKAVRAQGGDIQIRNIPGKGCVFAIVVPLADETVVPAPLGGSSA